MTYSRVLSVVVLSFVAIVASAEPPGQGASVLATNAAGFTNTLGMKFVPVPGTAVMFCIHETRRKDFATYAAEVPVKDNVWKSVDMYGVKLENTDNLPVFGVRYEGAVAFCSWLSKKEGRTYRLPTDKEWSYAADIGPLENWENGTTPEMRKNRKAGDFPWGKNFPPNSSDRAGNYGDTSRHERFPGDPYLSDYTDGFVTLAPVMSFKPNELGLYDMGGNVWEWVQDWWNENKTLHVLRGGSWTSSSRDHLRTSSRIGSDSPSVTYFKADGFRVVLEIPGAVITPVAVTPTLPTAAPAPVVVAPPSTPRPIASSAAVTPSASPAPTATTLVATVPTISTPSSRPAPPSPPAAPSQPAGGLVLDRNWATPMQGGSATMRDLGALLSPFAKAATDLAPSPGLTIFEGVTYLMPLAQAKAALNLRQQVVPKNVVACPGFPVSSLYAYCFDAAIDGHFNKLYLVTDKADQVVAVELLAESPKRDQVDAPNNATDWHTYDFINTRVKAITTLWIDHKPFFENKGRWEQYDPKYSSRQPSGETGLVRIDSLLLDPASTKGYKGRGYNWKPLKAMRLYLPKPMMELILQCISGAIK